MKFVYRKPLQRLGRLKRLIDKNYLLRYKIAEEAFCKQARIYTNAPHILLSRFDSLDLTL